MKIAISSTGPDLDSQVDSRFGRCQCFILVEPATEAFEVLDNAAAMMSGGAGIQAAQMVANSGAEAVVTGHVGPNAAETLAASGLKVYIGASGTVRQALEQYRSGQLQEASGSTVASHFGSGSQAGGGSMGGGRGMGRGMGPGRGMGGGRGMGMGRGMGGGRGMGMGRGLGRGMGRGYLCEPEAGTADDLEGLKRQKDQLREQLNRIEQKIKELEEK